MNFKGQQMATAKKTVVKKVVKATRVTGAPVKKVDAKINQATRLIDGEYAGLVGTVQKISEDGTRCKLLVEGVKDGEPVRVLDWFDAGQVVDAS